jgi:glycosyltransferase involved in cell wall biosynthesis
MQPDARPSSDRLIAFVLPDLRAGGVERLTIDLIGEFLARGFRVDLVLLEQKGEFLTQVPPGTRVVSLGAKRFRNAVLPLRRYFREERPDAACGAMWSLTVVTILAAAGLARAPRVVVSDHNPLLRQHGARSLRRLELSLSLLATYRFADGIVAVSDDVAGEVAQLAGLGRSRVTIIHNPVPRPACSAQAGAAWEGAKGKRILTVGRLKTQKNHALLIDAFAKLAGERDATLAIVGDGALAPELAALIRERGLENRVLLPGFTPTPGDWYEGADLFVLSSDYEGFGNVLVEAMHFGLPVISTDCPGGPREILIGGKWGRLVPPGDRDALVQAMAATLDEPVDAAKQRKRAADFTVERAADAYQALMVG